MKSYNNVDKEMVIELWLDVTQDPELIAKESGLDRDTVITILDDLQRNGDIDGWTEEVRDLNEALDPNTRKNLRLDQLKDNDYFFYDRNEKEIFGEGNVEIFVKRIRYSPPTFLGKKFHKEGVFIDVDVKIGNEKIDDIFIYVNVDDMVWYASDSGQSKIDRLYKLIDINEFNKMTEEVIDFYIPDNFFEIRSKVN